MAPTHTPDGRRITVYCDAGPTYGVWYVFVDEYPGSPYAVRRGPFSTKQVAEVYADAQSRTNDAVRLEVA